MTRCYHAKSTTKLLLVMILSVGYKFMNCALETQNTQKELKNKKATSNIWRYFPGQISDKIQEKNYPFFL